MKVLAALCDIFDCTPNDLITVEMLPARALKSVHGPDAGGPELTTELRPERARITDQ